MKTYYAFTFLILLSLFLTPFQSIQAGLVPVEKTSAQVTKMEQRANRQKFKKHRKQSKQQYKKRKRQVRKKRYLKPEQQNDYDALFVSLLVIVCSYFLIAILLMVFGFAFALPGLWVTGIVLLAIPLIIILVGFIAGAKNRAQYRKEERERKLQEEKEL